MRCKYTTINRNLSIALTFYNYLGQHLHSQPLEFVAFCKLNVSKSTFGWQQSQSAAFASSKCRFRIAKVALSHCQSATFVALPQMGGAPPFNFFSAIFLTY